jgi:hypothetical protein
MVRFRAPVAIGVVKSTTRTRPCHVLRLKPWIAQKGFLTGSAAEDASTSKAPLSPSQPPVDAAISSLPSAVSEGLRTAGRPVSHFTALAHDISQFTPAFPILLSVPTTSSRKYQYLLCQSPEDVLGKLVRFQISSRFWLAQAAQRTVNDSRQAVVILATPSFAPWLDHNSGFIPRLLQKLTEKINYKFVDLCEIDVVCACVDGISPTHPRIALKGEPSPEGFSFLRGLSAHVIQTAWAEEELDSSKVPAKASGGDIGGEIHHILLCRLQILFSRREKFRHLGSRDGKLLKSLSSKSKKYLTRRTL